MGEKPGRPWIFSEGTPDFQFGAMFATMRAAVALQLLPGTVGHVHTCKLTDEVIPHLGAVPDTNSDGMGG